MLKDIWRYFTTDVSYLPYAETKKSGWNGFNFNVSVDVVQKFLSCSMIMIWLFSLSLSLSLSLSRYMCVCVSITFDLTKSLFHSSPKSFKVAHTTGLYLSMVNGVCVFILSDPSTSLKIDMLRRLIYHLFWCSIYLCSKIRSFCWYLWNVHLL